MKRRDSRGFTLIELMIVVAIVGILTKMSLNYGGPSGRTAKMKEVTKGVATAFQYARAQALSQGKNGMVTIDGNQAVAFLDNDGDRVYTAATDTLIYRYPPGTSSVLTPGFQITGQALQEKQVGPNTAVYDRRGFYVDSFYGVTRHDAEVCITDTTTNIQQTVYIGRFGTIEIIQRACGTTAATCSTANLPTVVHR